MNLDYWARKITGRATCLLDRGAKLSSTARIRNSSGFNSSIKVGRRSFIAGELLTFGHGGSIVIGEWCFVGRGARIWSAGRIHIGNRVLISHNVNIFDSLTHPLDAARRHEHFRTIIDVGHPKNINLGERPVEIGDDAWIGAGSFILRGVTIGAGSIVGAGSVITHDVPAGCLYAGNPARMIRSVDQDKKATDGE